MNIGERYSDNRIYKGIKYYDQMPLMSEDLLEYEDLTNRKTDLVLTNLFENGLLNTPGLVTNLDGIFLSGPVNLLINGDVSIIQTDDSRPIVSMTDIEEAAQVSGSVCILGWYQHLTMSSVMRSYGGVDNSVIPNDLYNEDLRLQPSTRYQFRWTPIILPQSDVDPSQSQSSHFTCRVTDRDITGAKLSSTSVLSSIDRIGSLYLTDVPSSWDYVVEDHMYLIPLIRYTYEESTLSNTVFYDRIQVASGESGKVMTYAEFMRLTPDQQNHGEYYIPDYPEGPVIINGHTIVDENGTSFPARAKLKFINCDITDDSTNDTTIIEAKSNGTIIRVPTVTNTTITYDGTQKSPTITRDTDHTYIQGDYEATNYGTYTFTIGLSGVNDVWSDITTEPKTYTWSINYDGGTITPVNDIQTWLKCANIDDKAYTTLNEVLADHETLYALINNNNATDYLVRSTSWVSGITADETAMEYIGHKNYASNTLLGDSTWRTAICDSTYMESVLNTKVPTMTSSSTPSGEVFQNPASSQHTETIDDFKAFDSNENTFALISSTTGYIGYDFGKSVKIFNVYVKNRYVEGTQAVTFKIQASNDKTTWTDITSTLNAPTYAEREGYYKISPSSAYRYYIFKCLTSSNVQNFQIAELQFYGRTDITENQIDIYSAASDTVYYMDNGSPVTVCTTDTAGHGTVSKSSLPNGTYTLYSTVAKDPENLSNAYSKSVTVASNTVAIRVMPDGKVLYWFGYGADNVVIPPNTSENSANYFNSLGTTVTKNTNNVTEVNTSSPNLCAVGCCVEMDVTDISNVYVYGADLSIASSANWFFSAYLFPLTAKKSDNTIAYDENEIYQQGTQKTLDGSEQKELITMDVSTYTGNKYVVGGGGSYGTGRTKISNRVYAIWGA